LIVNQKKNASFRSTLEYVLGKEKSTLIDTNMGGETPRQLAAEFAAARRHRPNLKRACGHIIISIPHRNADHLKGEYHEHLEDEQYAALAHRWLKGMEFLGEGLSCSQYLIARHHDTLHEHIHIIASRIRMDGSVVSDSWDYRRSEVIVRQLEKEFGLEATPCSNERVAQKVEEKGISTTVSDRSAPTRKQKHHSDKPTVKQRLADLIDEACSDSPTVTQLIGRLQHQGVIVHPQFSTKGLFKEAIAKRCCEAQIAFELDGVKVAGNKLGSAYSFPGLMRRRGVSYDPERDKRALKAALSGEVVQLLETESDLPQLPTSEEQVQEQHQQPTSVDVKHLHEMSKRAEHIYPIACLVLKLAYNQGKYQEIAPGVWSFRGKKYAFAYNEKNSQLAIVHQNRGLLATYQSGALTSVGFISAEDLEVFNQWYVSQQRLQLQREQLPQPKPQPKKKSQREMD
jgi:hypothetical protein